MSTLKVNAFQDTSGNGFYPARVWSCLQGTGTAAILADDGLSSMTDHGTGEYSVTYSTTRSSANYSWTGSGQGRSSHYVQTVAVHQSTSPTTATLRFTHGGTGGTNSLGIVWDGNPMSINLHD